MVADKPGRDGKSAYLVGHVALNTVLQHVVGDLLSPADGPRHQDQLGALGGKAFAHRQTLRSLTKNDQRRPPPTP